MNTKPNSMSETPQTPQVIKGGLAVDDRGRLTFVNDFDFAGVKRFYMVENHESGFVRAWHGHKIEAKYVMVVGGSAIVAAVKVDNWDKPSKDLEMSRFVLSAASPSILYIPAGHANGFKTLTADTKVMFFSTTSMEEAKDDDFRFEADYWNPWEIVPR